MATPKDESRRPRLPAGARRLFRLPASRESLRDDVDREIAFHLAESERRLREEGWPPPAARREARRRFGSPGRVRGRCLELTAARERRRRWASWLHDLAGDLRLAFRQLRRAPAATAVAVVTLAVGIGATVAVFSVIHGVLLEPLPLPEPDRLVVIAEGHGPGGTEGAGDVSAGNFSDWRRHAGSFTALAATRGGNFNLAEADGSGLPERVTGARVTAAFFDVLAAPPLHGTVFGEAADTPGGPPVVVLSHRLFTRRFAADPALVGSTLRLDGVSHTVLGVLPPAVDEVPELGELWVPMRFTAERLAYYDDHTYTVLGRLGGGVLPDDAEGELRRIATALEAEAPDEQRNLVPRVTALDDQLVEGHRQRLLVLFGAVVFVLLIACTNVSHLLLVRSEARRREMAVRTALGARRLRLVRQLLVESSLLAVPAAGVGLGLAALLLALARGLAPAGVEGLDGASVDPRMALFAAGLAVFTTLAAGLAPAARVSRFRPAGALGRRFRGGGGRGRDPLRSGLVAAEVALALVLLVGAGLLVVSGVALTRVDPGYRFEGVLTARFTLPQTDAGEVRRTLHRLAEEAARMSGVEAAAIANHVPAGGPSGDNGLVAERWAGDPDAMVFAELRVVTPDYFRSLGLSPVAGRVLTPGDRRGARRVMVVNRTLARQMFGEADPVGQRVACCEGGPEDPRWKTVVGVVGDVRSAGPGREAPPQFYIPVDQAPDEAWDWLQRTLYLQVRSEGDPVALLPDLRRTASRVVPDLPLYDVASLEGRLDQAQRSPRFAAWLLTLLAGVGLLLAAVGIYATVAFLVEQRRHEIGVRMALGATARRVVLRVARSMLAPLAAGTALGVVTALGLARLLETSLPGVDASDPRLLVTVAGVLVGVGLAASLLPARRAARIDPARTLAAD